MEEDDYLELPCLLFQWQTGSFVSRPLFFKRFSKYGHIFCIFIQLTFVAVAVAVVVVVVVVVVAVVVVVVVVPLSLPT